MLLQSFVVRNRETYVMKNGRVLLKRAWKDLNLPTAKPSNVSVTVERTATEKKRLILTILRLGNSAKAVLEADINGSLRCQSSKKPCPC